MPRFNAHLGYQFTEFAPLERFEQAAKAGFKAVEWPAVYAYSPQQLRDLIEALGLTWIQVTLPFGDTSRGEKGMAAIPGREAEFQKGLESAIDYAKALGAKWIHPMAGVVGEWDATVRKTYLANISSAIKQAAAHGLGTLIEVIGEGEVPGYGMCTYARAEQVIAEPGCESLRLIYDTYHAQNITGDVIGQFRKLKDHIGHVQVADVPGRHEPGTGAIDFASFFAEIDRSGYSGWIGCEYKPATTTLAGLHHLHQYDRLIGG